MNFEINSENRNSSEEKKSIKQSLKVIFLLVVNVADLAFDILIGITSFFLLTEKFVCRRKIPRHFESSHKIRQNFSVRPNYKTTNKKPTKFNLKYS